METHPPAESTDAGTPEGAQAPGTGEVGRAGPRIERERSPSGRRDAFRAILRSAGTAAVLMARRRVCQPRTHLGATLCFADGTSARVYRDTAVRRPPTRRPTVLVVEFRLRLVRGRGHAAFRAESLLNTPLFVGFPGFVSKLWLAADQGGVYRGFYEWDDPELAHAYARALWQLLALVCVPGSIHYVVVPGRCRDELLADPSLLDPVLVQGQAGEWWRLVKVEPAPA